MGFFLFAGMAWSLGPDRIVGQTTYDQAPSGHSGDHAASAASGPSDSESTNRDTTQRNYHPNEKSPDDSMVAFWTALLVFVAAIQAAMFVWQLIYMREGVDDAAKAARAATRQAVAAEKAPKVVERAYLSVDNWLILNFEPDQPKGKTQVIFQYINSGRIPAEITGAVLGYKIGPDVPETPDYSQGLQVGHSIIRPYGTSDQPLRFPEPVTKEEFEKCMTREWCVFAWGEVRYTDNFGEDHKTGFATKAVYQRHDEKGIAVWAFEFLPHPQYTYSN